MTVRVPVLLTVAVCSAFVVSIEPGDARAALDVVIVDADVPADGCPGQGTPDDPFGSLQCALENAALRPGTHIQLRDAMVTYAGADTTALGLAAGTSADPIVIEPHPGHAPILDGSLTLADVDHYAIRNLVFDGSAGQTGGEAVRVTGGQGVTVEAVTIVGWEGEGIYLRNTLDALVRGCRIDGASGHAIWVHDADDTVVADNEVTAVQCVPSTFDLCIDCGADQCLGCGDCLDVADADCLELANFTVGAQVGVRVLGTSANTVIGRNWFHDFLGGGCGVDATNAAAVFITGPDVTGVRVHHNLIERITPEGGADGVGHAVLTFQHSTDVRIDHNIVVDPGHCGLCEGNFLFFGALAGRWEHNTVVGGRFGIDVQRGASGSFVNNLVTASAEAPVRVQSQALDEAPSLDNNVYFDGADGAVIGHWGDASDLDLAGWQSNCGCDGASVSGDPGLLQGGYTPNASSPAIDLGIDLGNPFHGTAPDAGALEPPRLLSALVPADAPSTVVIDLENRAEPPLASGSCAGVQAIVDEDAATSIGCTATTDERILLDLAEPIVAGQDVEVRVLAGAVRDSSRVGNRIDAWLADVAVAADNEAPPSTDSGTGTVGTTTSDSGSASSDTDGQSPAQDSSSGCTCRTGRGSAPGRSIAPWVLLCAAGRRRRS